MDPGVTVGSIYRWKLQPKSLPILTLRVTEVQADVPRWLRVFGLYPFVRVADIQTGIEAKVSLARFQQDYELVFKRVEPKSVDS